MTEGDTAAALNTSGQLTITDPDAGEAHVVAQTNAHGTYGDFSIDANGAWSYTGNGAHNELTAGQQVQDQFTVTSQDGTATRHGDGDDHRHQRRGRDRHPDRRRTSRRMRTSATATWPPPAPSRSPTPTRARPRSRPRRSRRGTLGSLTLQPNGAYTYSVANSAVQFLGPGRH